MACTTVIRRASALLAVVLLGAMLTAGRVHAQQQPVSPWQGWYAGALLGIAWTNVDISVPSSTFSGRHAGVTAGAFLGLKHHLTETIIAGLEADLTFGDLGGDFAFDRFRCSLVGHLGKLISPSTLIYGLAGLACGRFEANVSVSNSVMTLVFVPEVEDYITVTTTVTAQAALAKLLWGFVLGAGIETEDELFNWPVRWGLEYRYTNYQDWNFTVFGQGISIDPDVHDIRLRLIVPFNSAGQ